MHSSTSSPSPILVLLFGGCLGLYVIYMARKFYARPDEYISRWQNWLPQKPWTWRVVRGWAWFCIWGGCLITATSILQLTSIPHGFGPMFVICGIVVFCTYFLLPAGAKSIRTIGSIKRK